MACEDLGENALNYYPCRYGKSKLLFRGPRKKLNKPYIAVIGGSETYGKFVETPFPQMVEQLLEIPVANLGCVNAGTDAFVNDEDVIDICRKAMVTIIQVTGAQNMSNRYYSVHPRRNDRFLSATNLLVTNYPNVDFTEYHFTGHLLSALKTKSPERFDLVQRALKETWIDRMKTVLSRISGKVVLLWIADHAPGENQKEAPLGHDPMFVDRQLLDNLQNQIAGYVEVIATPEEQAAGYERMIYTPLEEPAAAETLGPIVHQAAAQQLQAAIQLLV